MRKKALIYILLVFFFIIFFMGCHTASTYNTGRSAGSNPASNTTTTQQTNTVVIFSFDGPQNVSVMIYRNNQLQQTITSGNSARITVPNGTHTFEAQLGNAGTSRIDTTRRRLSVSANGRNINISISARSIPMENIRITDFSITNATQSVTNTRQVENSDRAVANARPGDYIIRSNGQRVILTQGDINVAKGKISNVGRPTAPANLRASAITSSTCTLTWNAVSGAIGYYVYWSSSENGTYDRVGIITSPPPRNIINMRPGSNNYFRVTAFNSAGESSQSSYIMVTTRNN